MLAPDARSASDRFDALEVRSPEQRESELLLEIRKQIVRARSHAPAWAARLGHVDPELIRTRENLKELPVLRKQDLLEAQGSKGMTSDVFGGLATVGWGTAKPAERRALRVFSSPGPIFEPEGARRDYWRTGRALYAAGVRPGDLIHNSFSYHFTPAGAMMEAGAHAIGCTVFPAGTGQTDLQVEAISTLLPSAYVGTPSFLKVLFDRASELGRGLASVRCAAVSGEAFPPALRDWLGARGVEGYQSYATADIGLIAYETTAREGLVVEEGVLLEIVRPGTGDPVADGEVGEVVVTTTNSDYPLIRFATGDLSAILPGTCPTGRTNQRIRGWLGRADQSVKVRGMFVHPGQVAQVIGRHAEVRRARLIVSGAMASDSMTLEVECAKQSSTGLKAEIAQSVRDVTKLRCDVVLCPEGTLPNDGKVIEDRRATN